MPSTSIIASNARLEECGRLVFMLREDIELDFFTLVENYKVGLVPRVYAANRLSSVYQPDNSHVFCREKPLSSPKTRVTI